MNTFIGNILNHQFRRSQVIFIIYAMPLLLTSCSAYNTSGKEWPQKRGVEKLVTQINFSTWIRESCRFSPDSRRVAYVVKAGDQQFVVVDGKEEKKYDAIMEGTLIFSPDSKRVAYVAKAGDKKFVVVDGKEEKQYDNIGAPIFSPDSKRVAYVAKAGDKEFVVVDGKEEKQYDNIGAPIFSPDSKRVAYMAKAGWWFVVVDGEEEKEYHANMKDTLIFSPDSKRMAYRAKGGKKWFVVVDGKEEKEYDAIGATLIFSPDSRRVAYAAMAGNKLFNKWFVVVDGREEKEYDGIMEDTLIFSPDSKHLAYVATAKAERPQRRITLDVHGKVVEDRIVGQGPKSFVVVDGIEKKSYWVKGGYDIALPPIFSPDSKLVAYMAKAGNNWFVIVGENEKGQYIDFNYDRIYEAGRGNIVFDSTDKYHYLALKGNRIFLVEERIE